MSSTNDPIIDKMLADIEAKKKGRVDPSFLTKQFQEYMEESARIEQQENMIRGNVIVKRDAEKKVVDLTTNRTDWIAWREKLLQWEQEHVEKLGALPDTRDNYTLRSQYQACLKTIRSGPTALAGATRFGTVGPSGPLGQMMIRDGYAQDFSKPDLESFNYLPWKGSLLDANRELQIIERKLAAAQKRLTRAEAEYAAMIAAWGSPAEVTTGDVVEAE
jgi:hypothetical protein